MAKGLFQLYLDPDQRAYLARKSKETGRAMAAMVRELIDKARWEEEWREKEQQQQEER